MQHSGRLNGRGSDSPIAHGPRRIESASSDSQLNRSRRSSTDRLPPITSSLLYAPGEQRTHRKSAQMSAHTAQYPGGCVLTRRSLCVVRRRDSNKSADKAMKQSHHAGKVSAAFPPESPAAVHALCAALSPGVLCCCFPLPLFAAGALHWRMRPLGG